MSVRWWSLPMHVYIYIHTFKTQKLSWCEMWHQPKKKKKLILEVWIWRSTARFWGFSQCRLDGGAYPCMYIYLQNTKVVMVWDGGACLQNTKVVMVWDGGACLCMYIYIPSKHKSCHGVRCGGACPCMYIPSKHKSWDWVIGARWWSPCMMHVPSKH